MYYSQNDLHLAETPQLKDGTTRWHKNLYINKYENQICWSSCPRVRSSQLLLVQTAPISKYFTSQHKQNNV